MQTRRPLAILAATAITVLGLTALATPASASTTITISGSDTSDITVSPSSIPGSSVTVENNYAVTLYLSSQALLDGLQQVCDYNNCEISRTGTATFGIVQDAVNAEVRITDALGETVTVATFRVSYSAEATAPSAAGGPAPVVQQFEKPSSGTCDDAQPEGLNWGGASSGGWGESWAQWANAGQGGTVCTRTLAYNNSTATWLP